ncbi:hypothetical protein [Paraburkholderia sp. RL17-337-BIB-A]|uniref:hypothetical protein n=1 Tax=Paraburkholderia sp. RL17-337-BIB-A TaxID=3031636 RepID=UPI0038BCABC5
MSDTKQSNSHPANPKETAKQQGQQQQNQQGTAAPGWTATAVMPWRSSLNGRPLRWRMPVES